MNISGILVVTQPSRLDSTIAQLRALPGVDVHQVERETGRIVVTQEAPSTHDEVDGLQRIQALPDVAMAEMVYHYFAEDGEVDRPPTLRSSDAAEPPIALED